MKKIFIFLSISILILVGISPALNGETRKGLHFGISFGTFPFVAAFNSYRVGGEIGYQFTDRVGINMEFGYGYITSNYESDEQFRGGLQGLVPDAFRDHVPLIYTVHLWNHLISGNQSSSSEGKYTIEVFFSSLRLKSRE